MQCRHPFAEILIHYLILSCLQREEQWSNWKNEGCKEFQTPGGKRKALEDSEEPLEGKRPIKAKRRGKALGDLIKDSLNQGKTLMGKSVRFYCIIYLALVCLDRDCD